MFVPTPHDGQRASGSDQATETAKQKAEAAAIAPLLLTLGDPLFAEEFANLDGFQVCCFLFFLARMKKKIVTIFCGSLSLAAFSYA